MVGIKLTQIVKNYSKDKWLSHETCPWYLWWPWSSAASPSSTSFESCFPPCFPHTGASPPRSRPFTTSPWRDQPHTADRSGSCRSTDVCGSRTLTSSLHTSSSRLERWRYVDFMGFLQGFHGISSSRLPMVWFRRSLQTLESLEQQTTVGCTRHGKGFILIVGVGQPEGPPDLQTFSKAYFSKSYADSPWQYPVTSAGSPSLGGEWW